MRRFTLLLVFMSLLVACSDSTPPPIAQTTDEIVSIEIDGTRIFVPKQWGIGRSASARPWRNGVIASNGGWGRFTPRLGALEGAGQYDSERPKDGIFRASSTGQEVDPRDPFFCLSVTFEFPLPPVERSWWGGRKNKPADHFTTDMMHLAFHAPGEKPMPYLALLGGLAPDDGDDLGDGWRVVAREFKDRRIWLRFDSADWRRQGGALPRRLAVSWSSSSEGIWDHHLVLSPRGWSIDFTTIRLPQAQWRSRHETAEELYDWLRTEPAKRNANARFVWWADFRDRLTH